MLRFFEKQSVKPGSSALILLALFLGLFLVYADTIFIPYAHHDQYRHFIETFGDPGFKNNCGNDVQNLWLKSLGRPFAADLECLIFKHTDRLTDLSYFRLLGILVLSVFGLVTISALHRQGMSRAESFAISISICSLPGMQNAIFMTNLPNVVSPLLSILSAYLLTENGAMIRPSESRFTRNLIRLPAAVAILLLSFLTYPPLTFMFFFVSASAVLIHRDVPAETLVRVFFRDSMVFLAAFFAYLLLIKNYSQLWIDPSQVVAITNDYKISISFEHFGDRLHFLFSDVFPRILNLWNIYPSNKVTALVIFLVILGALTEFRRFPSKREFKCNAWFLLKALTPYFIIFGCLIATLSLFIFRDTFVLYRLFVPASACMVLIIFISARRLLEKVTHVTNEKESWLRLSFAAFFFAPVLIAAHATTTLNVLNSYNELSFIKYAISNHGNQLIKRIHLIRPPNPRIGFNGRTAVTDEFNRPTTSYGFGFAQIVRLALLDLGKTDRPVIDGTSYLLARKVDAQIFPVGEGRWRLVNELGVESVGVQNESNLYAEAWQIKGRVSPDKKLITWENGSKWSRETGSGYLGLSGKWVVRVKNDDALWVTISEHGEPIQHSDSMLIIDLGNLQSSTSIL